MELSAYKNIERVFNATTQQEQVIAEDNAGYGRGFNSCPEFYLKEDVDAVIAEKDELITSLQDTNKVLAHNGVRLNKMLDEKDVEIAEIKAHKARAEDDCAYWKTKAQRERHHKYRRCVGKAEWCIERIARIERDYAFWQYGKDYAQNFYKKWYKRWLELAAQFKEAK